MNNELNVNKYLGNNHWPLCIYTYRSVCFSFFAQDRVQRLTCLPPYMHVFSNICSIYEKNFYMSVSAWTLLQNEIPTGKEKKKRCVNNNEKTMVMYYFNPTNLQARGLRHVSPDWTQPSWVARPQWGVVVKVTAATVSRLNSVWHLVVLWGAANLLV